MVTEGVPSTVFSDWTGTENKISFWDAKLILSLWSGKNKLQDYCANPRIIMFLYLFQKSLTKFPSALVTCKFLEEIEEKTGSASLVKLCFVRAGRWVQPQINDLFYKAHVIPRCLLLQSLFGARLGHKKSGF